MIVLLIAHKAEAQCFFRRMTFRKETCGYLSGDTCLVITGNKDRLSRHILPGIKKLKQDFKEIHLLNLGFAAVLNRRLPLDTPVQVDLSVNESGETAIPLTSAGLNLPAVRCITVADSRQPLDSGNEELPVVVDMELFRLAGETRRLALPLSSVKIVSDFYEQHVPARVLIEKAAPLSCQLYDIYQSFQEKLNDLV